VLGDNARELATAGAEAVREHAVSAGESVAAAVTGMLDSAAERGRKAGKKARKQAKKSRKQVNQAGRDARQRVEVATRRRRPTRHRKRRGVAALGGLLAVGAVATVFARRSHAEPEPPAGSEPPGDRLGQK
jgi:ElaB/YqjD/DUF883 family membrane-anchored ribosome-binding protein